MFLTELAEPQLIVIYPGRFQPFHKGHHAVYNFLINKFGRNNVWIATSNKIDGDKSPFSFSEKSYFMQLTGVPADRIIEATEPYNIQNVLSNGGISVPNPNHTVAIFAVSKKDMAEDPRFKSWTKKDGSPSYFQPLTNLKQTRGMKEHGYIMTVPTFDFKVLGKPMRSGTELRAMYKNADPKTRQLIIKDLFGKYTSEAKQLMSKLIPSTPVIVPTALPKKTKLTKVPKPKPISEAGGVGVVKNSNDKRYSTATMGDQNSVTGDTLGKEMKAFRLTGTKSPGKSHSQSLVTSNIGKGLKEEQELAALIKNYFG